MILGKKLIQRTWQLALGLSIASLPTAGLATLTPIFTQSETPPTPCLGAMPKGANFGQNSASSCPKLHLIAADKEFQISGVLIAQLLNNAVQGTTAHFNNLGPRKGDSWHQAQSSYIQLPSLFGNLRQKFDIPEVTKPLSCGSLCPSLGMAKLYVNNFDLNQIQLAYLNQEFRLRLEFESDGPEVKTYIVGPLAWLNDRGVPNVEINNARLDLFLRPKAVNGALSYEVTRTNFTADIKATGACSFAGQDICASLFDYRKFLVAQIETKSRQLLNDPTLRQRVNGLLQPQLDRLGVKSVSSVTTKADQLILTISR